MFARELEQDCKRCKGSGVVFVDKKKTTVLVCSCHAARHLAAQMSRAHGHWANGERRG